MASPRAPASSPSRAALLTPGFLQRLASLEVIARTVVEGFISGKHKSPYKGFSTEFAEHRPYVPGDSVREIDWRVYAKSDRYYVKQFEQETNLVCHLLVDASASMRYGESKSYSPDAVGKLAYAKQLAACFAYLLLRQSDAVGLTTFDSGIRTAVPARSRPAHLHDLLRVLTALEPANATGLSAVLHGMAERVKRRGMLVVITDAFDDVDDVLLGLQHVRHRRHEVLMLHVMHADELTFPFARRTQFQALESPDDRLQVDPLSARQRYLARVESFCRTLRDGCGRLGIDYARFSTADPPGLALPALLASRLARA